ncbi:glycosyl hydrolase family 28-related protein [Sphingomonas phyllosphaerae]|uniref:glycosyl hydrolase family 28-related protein n=1 Tax=Sphingomonas phyllosphaerae TaxID=257003 RepID=UPI0003B6C692|nr:glycosyl hydrolase family 28-related protein [Sphingomonas phyllosphaerae]
MLYVTNFGAKFDGVTDDSQAIQTAIDTADAQGEPLSFPGRTAVIRTALNLRNRTVEIYGTMKKTVLRAATVGMTMIDAESPDEIIYSPFKINGIQLDGANRADYCIRIRNRHHSELNGVFLSSARVANAWERETWVSRRYNCRVEGGPVGWQLEGSNFDSAFYGCYIAGCSDTQWLLNNNGTLLNGNNSLLFSNCGATDGSGRGVVLNGQVVANFHACYFGENLDRATVVNNGAVAIFEGGTLSFGWTPQSYLVIPAGGETLIQNGAQLNGQDYGSVNLLSYLSPAQQAAAHGTFRLDDTKAYLITGGDQIVQGDVLGYGEQRNVLVPRLGRQFTAIGNSVTLAVSNPKPNAQRVTCSTVSGGNPIIGLYAPLSRDYRVSEPFYLVLVYRASRPLQIRVDASPLGADVVLLSFPPASTSTATLIKLDAPLPPVPTGAVLDILMPNAAAGDFIEISECFLTDATAAAKGIAPVNRLSKC